MYVAVPSRRTASAYSRGPTAGRPLSNSSFARWYLPAASGQPREAAASFASFNAARPASACNACSAVDSTESARPRSITSYIGVCCNTPSSAWATREVGVRAPSSMGMRKACARLRTPSYLRACCASGLSVPGCSDGETSPSSGGAGSGADSSCAKADVEKSARSRHRRGRMGES